MHLIRQLPITCDRATAVAIGNFDGLHRGHQAVIAAMVEAARAKGVLPSVLTFDPHPRQFFNPSTPAFRIERLRDKLLGLREGGVERVVMPRFHAAFARMPAAMFLEDVLGRRLGAQVVVTGENFAFGHQRSGDRALLQAWGAAQGVTVITVPPVSVAGLACSSTAVRTAMAAGDMKIAAQLLGRPYALSGQVVHGDGRGRTIGFPTANISLPSDLLMPRYGVYAVRVVVDGVMYEGVANLGIRPTVAVDKRPSLEVHLFDVVQDFYGKTARVLFVDKLRDEMKFDTIDRLRAQIVKDCVAARIVLEGAV